MLVSSPAQRHEFDAASVKALDQSLILLADEAQDCATATVRMVGSSGAGVFAAVAAAIGALSGALHSGATGQVIQMLEVMEKDGGGVRKFSDLAKRRQDPQFRLRGVGHRLRQINHYDPRPKVLRDVWHGLLSKAARPDPLSDLARQLEEELLRDSHFVQRKLYPNVDFYSALLWRAIGIPTGMFPVMLAIARLPGWLAHWKELVGDPWTRLYRPRQIYTGPTLSRYIPVDERTGTG
jgi:citrate synthase